VATAVINGRLQEEWCLSVCVCVCVCVCVRERESERETSKHVFSSQINGDSSI